MAAIGANQRRHKQPVKPDKKDQRRSKDQVDRLSKKGRSAIFSARGACRPPVQRAMEIADGFSQVGDKIIPADLGRRLPGNDDVTTPGRARDDTPVRASARGRRRARLRCTALPTFLMPSAEPPVGVTVVTAWRIKLFDTAFTPLSRAA